MDLEMIARPITHVTLNGKKVALFKLSLGDIADLDQRLQSDYEQDRIAKAHRIYGDELPDNVKADLMRDLTDSELDALRGTPKGARYMLWRALTCGFPGITEEHAANVIPTDDMEMVMNAISPKDKKKSRKPVKK